MDNEDLQSRSTHRPQGDVILLPVSCEIAAHASVKPAKASNRAPAQVAFDRRELSEILKIYGRRVAEGEWRDYAMDFQKDRAVFSIFKRTSEMPVYRVEKDPRLARKQGAYAVVNANGMILKRGHELRQVLKALEPRRHLKIVD